MVVARTGSHMLVGSYTASMQPAICIEAVENFAEYVRAKGN